MKKVEIEILQYEATTISNSFTGDVVDNGTFNVALGDTTQKGCSSCPGTYGGQAATAMNANPPVVGNWKGYVSRDSGGVGSIAHGTPCFISSGKLHIPNEPAAGSTAGHNVSESGIYQNIIGMMPNSPQTLEIEVDSLPSGATANDMNGVFFTIGIYDNFNGPVPPNRWESSTNPGVYNLQANNPGFPFNSATGCIQYDFNTPLVVGTNTINFTWCNLSEGTLVISVRGNSNLNGYGFQDTIISSISLDTSITTYSSVVNQTGSVVGKLDLTDSANFPLSMTYGVADGNNFESIFGDYSKTFEVPATKNNRKLLGFIDDEKMVDSKNITDFKEARIVVDGLDFLLGKLKLTGSTKRKSPEFYQCVFYGGNADWGAQLKGKRMCDITLEKGDGFYVAGQNPIATYNFTQIAATWVLDYNNADMVYPLVSYGDFYPNGPDGEVNFYDDQVDSQDWRAWFYVWNLMEYIFKGTGYKIKSTWAAQNSDWFKKLITQFQWQKNSGEDLSEQAGVRVFGFDDTTNVVQEIANLAAPNISYSSGDVTMKVNTQDYDQMNQYDSTTGLITVALDGRAKISTTMVFRLGFAWGNSVNANYGMDSRIHLEILKGGTQIATTTTSYFDFGIGSSAASNNVWKTVTLESDWEYVTAGETFQVRAELESNPQGSVNSQGWYGAMMGDFQSSSVSEIIMEFDAASIPINTSFPAVELLPCNTKITDFIKGIAHMFNLYFVTDVHTKTVTFEPFPFFYNPVGSSIDWSNKIDLSKQIVDKFQTGLSNEVLFKYKEDSNDKYKQWKQTDLGLQYPFYSWYAEFQETGNPGLTTYENPLFDGMLMEHDRDAMGNQLLPPVMIPVMEKEVCVFGINTSTDVARPEKGYFGPKILWYDGYVTDSAAPPGDVAYWRQANSPTWTNQQQTYPKSVFVDFRNAGTNPEDLTNLSYNDEIRRDGRILPGLVNLFWIDMLEQMAHNPRIRTIYLNLKPIDIYQLNLQALVYIDGSYWRVLRILDYSPAKNESTKVEIIQWIDTVAYLGK